MKTGYLPTSTRGASRRPLALLLATALLITSLSTPFGTGVALADAPPTDPVVSAFETVESAEYEETESTLEPEPEPDPEPEPAPEPEPEPEPAPDFSVQAEDDPLLAFLYDPASGIANAADSVAVTAEVPSAVVPVLVSSAEAASVDTQWLFGPVAPGTATQVEIQLVPLSPTDDGGMQEGEPLFSTTLSLSSTDAVTTPWYRIALQTDQQFDLKVTATLADGATGAQIPVGGTLVQPLAGSFTQTPLALSATATTIPAVPGCINEYFFYDGDPSSVQWTVTHNTGSTVTNLSATLFRQAYQADGSILEEMVAGSDTINPGQVWQSDAAAPVDLVAGLYRIATCGFHPSESAYSFSAAHSLDTPSAEPRLMSPLSCSMTGATPVWKPPGRPLPWRPARARDRCVRSTSGRT